jgi:GTPase SAR1 family protein
LLCCIIIYYVPILLVAKFVYCRSVTRSYYRGAAGALLVYDITRYSKTISNFPKENNDDITPKISAVKQMGFPAVSSYFVGNFL